jgi:hypothetical protein
MIEKSIAIKGPRIEYQLMTAKKFQQFLYQTKTIEEVLKNDTMSDLIRATFVKQMVNLSFF